MLTRVPINVAKNFRMGDAPHPHELPNVGESPGKYARMLGLVSLNPYSTTKSWATQTGEISPAQALGMIRKDPRYPMLNSQDFTSLTNNLKDRCRCYGYVFLFPLAPQVRPFNAFGLPFLLTRKHLGLGL